MKLKLKDVYPNPFRDFKGNPLIEAKLKELVNSIEISGYWDNCVATLRDGKYCLAYGHHRWEAAKRAGLTEADFIIKDLDDAMLIKVMDLENRETYASSPASMIEAVKAVVQALHSGSVNLLCQMKADPSFNFGNRGIVGLRYAPSYVPVDYSSKEKEGADKSKAYTPLAIARFLGRVISNGGEEEKPAKAIEAALDFLCLKELGKISNAVLVKDTQPISSTKLAEITTEIKQRHVAEVVRRGKTQAELSKFREEQLELQRKQKEQKEAEEEKRKALLKREAEARRAENEAKADALAARIKEADKRAQEKDALNKLRLQELDEKIAQKRAWEAEQKVQDSYASIRRDVESLIRTWETKVSERDAERERVKSLAKLKALRPEDRLRLRKAAVAVADHYNSWVAAQFAPLPTDKDELKELAKREKEKNNAHR